MASFQRAITTSTIKISCLANRTSSGASCTKGILTPGSSAPACALPTPLRMRPFLSPLFMIQLQTHFPYTSPIHLGCQSQEPSCICLLSIPLVSYTCIPFFQHSTVQITEQDKVIVDTHGLHDIKHPPRIFRCPFGFLLSKTKFFTGVS